MQQYDAIILGFGKGGKTLAATLAAAGQRVAMVERSDHMYGGTCINVGCIPSKSLITSAKASVAMGGTAGEKAARYTAAVQERERLTAMLRKKNHDKLANLPNVDVLTGIGVFIAEKTIRVTGADASVTDLNAPKIFINTGAASFVPPIDGVQQSKYVYLSDTLMALETLPKRLLIVGGGYIGMEFASMYANFGAKVTVVQDGTVFLPREDAEIAQSVQQRLQAQGVAIQFGVNVQKIEDQDGYAQVLIKTDQGEQTLEAEAILLATGRRPNAKQLNPEKASVEVNTRGAVVTDAHLRTTAPGIWAMGDITGGLQFTYISLDDYRIVRSDVLQDGSRTKNNRGQVPYSVFLDPPFSRVGLSEKEALEKGYEIKVAKLPAAAIPKAQVLHETDGLLKAIVDKKTDQILGAHLFCAESHEMINLIKLAMDAQLPYTVLRDQIFTHPTMSEALNDLFQV